MPPGRCGPAAGRAMHMSRIPKRLTRIREIIQRAEQIVEDQRARVEQCRSEGNQEETDKAWALLTLMEKAAQPARQVQALLRSGPLVRTLGGAQGARFEDHSRPDPSQQTSSIWCPDCGLETRYLKIDDGGITIEYDHAEWSKRCQRRHLRYATLCQFPAFGYSGTVH